MLAALSVPLLIRRRLDRRPWLLAALLVQLGGFCGLLLMPLQHAALWVALIGYGLGACFALSLTLTLDHLHEPRAAGSLAAFVQGIGFIITGIVPYLTGWLRDATGSFRPLAAARGERGGDVAGDPALRPVRLCPGHGRDARLSGGPPRPPLQARVALQ